MINKGKHKTLIAEICKHTKLVTYFVMPKSARQDIAESRQVYQRQNQKGTMFPPEYPPEDPPEVGIASSSACFMPSSNTVLHPVRRGMEDSISVCTTLNSPGCSVQTSGEP